LAISARRPGSQRVASVSFSSDTGEDAGWFMAECWSVGLLEWLSSFERTVVTFDSFMVSLKRNGAATAGGQNPF